MQRLIAAVIVLASLGAALPARSETWPARPVKFVVPYPAGGPTDILGRVVAQKLADRLGQPVVIDNKPGASGMIGAEQVARAKPDGYTILVNASIHVINPSLYAKMTFDPIADFAPVTNIAAVPLVLVVGPSVPAGSMRELIALAKAKPGALSYASSGIGAAPHLAGALLNNLAGIDMVHVPYKGSGPAIADVAGGHVTLMIDSMPSSMALVQSGGLRALGVSTARRTPALPDVPTIAESGVPGFDIATWYGIWAPAGTPREIVGRLQAEVAATLTAADVKERLAALGAEPVGDSPEAFDAYCRSERARWAEMVRLSGARLE